MANTCDNTCLSCSDVREIASAADIGFINENFAQLQKELDAALSFIKLYLVKDGCSDSTIDANFGCVTNVKDCPCDPNTAMPRDAIEAMIREMLADKNSCKTKKLPRECDPLPRKQLKDCDVC